MEKQDNSSFSSIDKEVFVIAAGTNGKVFPQSQVSNLQMQASVAGKLSRPEKAKAPINSNFILQKPTAFNSVEGRILEDENFSNLELEQSPVHAQSKSSYENSRNRSGRFKNGDNLSHSKRNGYSSDDLDLVDVHNSNSQFKFQRDEEPSMFMDAFEVQASVEMDRRVGDRSTILETVGRQNDTTAQHHLSQDHLETSVNQLLTEEKRDIFEKKSLLAPPRINIKQALQEPGDLLPYIDTSKRSSAQQMSSPNQQRSSRRAATQNPLAMLKLDGPISNIPMQNSARRRSKVIVGGSQIIQQNQQEKLIDISKGQSGGSILQSKLGGSNLQSKLGSSILKSKIAAGLKKQVKLKKDGLRQQSSLIKSKTQMMNRSNVSQSQLNASVIPKANAGFYASVRQLQTEKDSQADNTLLKGDKFIKQTQRLQANRYEKKFTFERGRYIQCIPNPRNDNQRITVQIVERVLDEQVRRNAANINKSMVESIFGTNQDRDVETKTQLQTYERYSMVSPEEAHEKLDDGEGQTSDSLEDEFEALKDPFITDQSKNPKPIAQTGYNGVEQKLYTDKSLFRDVDKLLGIQNQHYAEIEWSISNQMSAEARMKCREFAVVAFWDLNDGEVLQCSHFFIVPNPTKRIIKTVQETTLEQVLQVSESTKEVFFMWKGYETAQTIEDVQDIDRPMVVQISFLELELSPKQIEEIGEIRHIGNHCKQTFSINKNSVLDKYITRNHELALEDQNQMPSPTIANIKLNVEDAKETKLLVFTAYLLEIEGKTHASWYPSIHFYDIANKKIVWTVFGAEQFIRVGNQKVQVLSNTVWSKLSEDDYKELKQNEESRHQYYDNQVCKLRFGTPCTETDLEKIIQAPPMQLKTNTYKLTFGKNKNLEITEHFKVMSAHSHNMGKRVTLLYQGLGCFTFELQQAKSLTQESLWNAVYKGSNFNCQLKFNQAGMQAIQDYFESETVAKSKSLIQVSGEGQIDDSEVKVSLRANLVMDDETSYWHGMIECGDLVSNLDIQCLKFDYSKMRVSAKWQDENVSYSLEGKIGKLDRRKAERELQFTLRTESDRVTTQFFRGFVDQLHSEIHGKCGDVNNNLGEELKYPFSLNQASDFIGEMTIQMQDTEYNERIKFNFVDKKITKLENSESEFEIKAIEAIDQAVLIYSILKKDVQFLQIEGKSYIQAKLTALEDEDVNSNGKGVTETSAILYCVSSDKKKEKDQKKLRLAGEPKDRINFRFFLNQSFLRTQQHSNVQLIHVGSSVVSATGKIYGSVIYEEYGSNENKLNMFSATQEKKEDELNEKLCYFQEPVEQSWIVDYPLLAYKTFTPKNKEIAIVHMAQDMPQRIINLGDWEFVCFVNHTQMVEQKCFKKTKETNCDIMFLVRRKDRIRLMSFKSNPWLHYTHLPTDEEDTDVVKQSVYIFSGDIGVIPTEDFEGNRIEQDLENLIKYKQRFNNDKVQSCQLITKQLGSYDQFMLIIQFNGSIVQASLNRNFFRLICEPETMVRRHLVRGYNEKIYFAETSGNVDKIFQMEFHSTKNNEIVKKEIYQLAGGQIVALEPDGECIENDTDKTVTQSLFIMDDQQKIYLLKNEDNVRFIVKKTIDFTKHNVLQEVNSLRDTPWAHVHITERTLTMGGTIYNLNTQLKVNISFPKAYFGQKQGGGLGRSMHTTSTSLLDSTMSYETEHSSESEDSDIEVKKENKGDNWLVTQVQGMSMTTNIILVGHRSQREFCFLLKPAPGSRKISIVGFQQLHEIEQMLFVSNTHVLLKLRGGKSVTLLSNGSIVHQEQRVQTLLEESERVIGESQVFRGRKTVLLEDDYVDTNEMGEQVNMVRHITLSFARNGVATTSGIYKDYKDQTDKLLQTRIREIRSGALDSPRKEQSVDDGALLDGIEKVSQAVETKLVKTEVQERKKLIRFAKEFFITEKGEIIKMAAIISPNPKVHELIKEKVLEKQKAGKKKIKSGTLGNAYISIFAIENMAAQNPEKSGKLMQDDDDVSSCLTVIAIHCINKEQQDQLVQNTQYCVVGNYLCSRQRDEQVIWVTKLKEDVDDLLQRSKRRENENELAYKEYISVALSIDKMTRKIWIEHIQLTEVPKSYYTTIKSRKPDNSLVFFSNLLQVTIGSNGMIFDLDSDPIREVASIESIDQLFRPDFCTNTGFIMSISHKARRDEVKYLKRVQIFTNEHCNLVFEKQQSRFNQNNEKDKFAKYKIDFKISGMLYRTYSEIDLCELQQLQNLIERRAKINYIDPESILANYEGHTIFSIFFDRIEVFEQIFEQLSNQEFLPEEDINGFMVENSYLRRLHRVLHLPTADLLHYKHSSRQRTQDKKDRKKSKLTRCCTLFCGKLFARTEKNKKGKVGYKSLPKKSMHFTNARSREAIIEISELCQENAINDFVENLEDIDILFKSMSPTVYTFLQNAFKTTRFTRDIKNADWRLGKHLEVIGQQTSIAIQKDMNKIIKQRQNTVLSDNIDVQNRQVETQMLQIDWIFAECPGKKDVGFADFVVKLSQAPHESLFSTDLVTTLVTHFWSRYYSAVILKCFIPFVAYMACTLLYISNFAVHGYEVPDDFWFTNEFILRVFTIVLMCYFLYFEIRCIIRDRFAYLIEIYNYLDLISFILNIWLIHNATKGETTQQQRDDYIRTLGAIAVILMWVKSFYWLRLFGKTSFFVRMISETLYDIKYFLILFIFILMTFGNAMLILSSDRQQPLYKDYFGVGYMNVVLNQYELSLGEFDTEQFNGPDAGGDAVAWFVFIGATLITQIMFLNMLIAIMGDTFERVTEQREQSALVEKIRILADYVFVVPKELEAKGTMNKYLFAIRPSNLGQDELGSWEGTATLLNKSIERNIGQAKQLINNRMSALSTEVADGYKKISTLEERLNDLHGATQRQQGLIEQVLRHTQQFDRFLMGGQQAMLGRQVTMGGQSLDSHDRQFQTIKLDRVTSEGDPSQQNSNDKRAKVSFDHSRQGSNAPFDMTRQGSENYAP